MNTVIESGDVFSDNDEKSLDNIFSSIEGDFIHIIETCDILLSQLAVIRQRVTEMGLYIDGLPAPEWINQCYSEFQMDTIHNITWGQYLIEKLHDIREN